MWIEKKRETDDGYRQRETEKGEKKTGDQRSGSKHELSHYYGKKPLFGFIHKTVTKEQSITC